MENATASYTQQDISVVAFQLNQRTFALPLEVIVQILPMMTIIPIPHLSNIVKGAINIRGEDVLVISLRVHFNMEEVEPQLYTPLLLLKLKDHSLALMVDSVLDVMNLPVEGLTGLQDMLPEGIENIPLLRGVSYYKDDTILLLDPDNLFYNHQSFHQYALEPIPSEIFDLPLKKMPVEAALVSEPTKTPIAKKKPAARKRAVANDTPATEDISMETGGSAAKDAPTP